MKRWLLPLVPPAIAVVASLLVGAGFILAVGQDPVQVYGAMASGVFGSPYGWGQVLFKATPLIFTGLAVALGFRAGLFNIGAEGQALMGSFVMGVVGADLAPRLPGFAVLIVAALAGLATGALYATIPGLLKARFGAHEVINTIMLNFIAAALINYFGHTAFVHETVHTPELPPSAMLARLGAWWPALQGSPVNLSLFLAAIACVAVGLLLWRTPFGYELRATGMNPGAAEYGGARVPSVWVKTMALSGALSALVGVNFVFGYKGYFESGFTSGVGFLGIAVALLGRTHPVGVVLAAFFFGALSQGGLVINSLVPKELVDILQAIVILMAIVSHETVERWMREALVTGLVIAAFLAQTVRISVPYAYGAMGCTFSERGGVVNIAAEGIFLLAALSYTLAAYYSGSAWLGVLAAIAAGLLTGALHALVTVTFRADQITSGLGINLLAVGLTRFVLKAVFHSSSNSEHVAGIAPWSVPGLSSVPGLGALFETPLVLVCVTLVVFSWWLLFRTPFGLRLRSVGEHPEAAATLGLDVSRLRYAGVLLSGAVCGLGGAWLASDQRSFTDQMSAGRGYIALAAMIVGKWNPVGAALACLLFGAAESLQIRLQGAGIPNEFLQMLPYVVTMLVLAGAIGRARPPAAVGKPYDPESNG